jgi:putative ABC transport system permease protein
MADPLPWRGAMDLLWKDVRYALHTLTANPSFALIAILTLALGIGATTTIFSVVNGVLLQPLPLKDPDRLVTVAELRLNEPGAQPNHIAPANFTEWTRQTGGVFSSLAATFDWEMSLTGQTEPEVVRVGLSNGKLFPTLAVQPLLGQTFSSDDDKVTVLSHALWQRKFGGDRGAIGKRIEIDGDTLTIIGVMPREFFVPSSRADLWVPYAVPPQVRGRYLRAIARLKPGVTVQQAQAAMDVVTARTRPQHVNNTDYGAIVIPAHEEVVGSVRRALLIVFAAVGLLLLIGCVNIANLLLSRATSRSREMAVRAALGASRGQLIRQLLTESLILALVAGVAGVAIATWATKLLVRVASAQAMMPRLAEITVDGRVLLASAAIALFTGILFGLAPAVEASRTDLQSGLKSVSRGSTQDRRGTRFRNVLVVSEVALATVLLIGAGLLIKSFTKLENVDPGVRPDRVLTMRVVLPSRHHEPEKRLAFVQQMLEGVRAVPGVKGAGAIVSINMPFTGSLSNTDFVIEGAAPPAPGHEPEADIRVIAGDYHRAMGIPILAGRALDERTGRPEFVVNEAFARRYLGGGTNAVGRRLMVPWFEDLKGEIVGMVGNVRAAGLEKDIAPAIYFSHRFDPNPQFTLAVATSGDPAAAQGSVTRKLRSLDALMPVTDVKTLGNLVSGTIARPRFNATLLTLFAALGLLLASIGIYGVLSYTVAQRTQETGIRMALGARPSDVLKLVVRDGVTVAVIGVVAGVAVALPATRLLAALLYGVDASDPAVFAIVAGTLTLVAFAASYLPALRATRVDPMLALRAD